MVTGKTIYLETSAIRYLYARLDKLKSHDDCFTSALTLLELITNLQNDFSIRKNCVKKIMENISIDWQFPEAIVAEAFPLIKSEEFRTLDFQLLCTMLTKTDSYEEFIKESEKLKLTHDINYFVETDKFHAANFVKASVDIVEETKELLQKEENSRIIPFESPLVINKRKDFNKLHEDYPEFNIGWTLQSFCEMYAQQLQPDNAVEVAEKLYYSYNNNIDYYITAYSYYNISKIAKGNVSSVNDRIDLEHFLYLRNNPEIRIVSNDKLIRSICETIWTEKCINPEALLNV